MQDYKSLRVAVMICATLVNTQTHTDSLWPVILLAQPAELKMANCRRNHYHVIYVKNSEYLAQIIKK